MLSFDYRAGRHTENPTYRGVKQTFVVIYGCLQKKTADLFCLRINDAIQKLRHHEGVESRF